MKKTLLALTAASALFATAAQAQSATYAIVGSVLGLGMVTFAVEGIRQALLVPIIPHFVIYLPPS
mgnify:CR=1 FL=1